MSSKKILILGASILQLPAIQKAKQMGLQVVVLDVNPDAVGFQETGITSEIISTIDVPAVLKCAKKHRVDGVMTLASDMPMRTVAVVAKEMGLVGISGDTALKATNKACMRMALQEYNVAIPRFFKVSNREEYDRAVSNFQIPFMVKPADNSGSRGIIKISDPNDKTAVNDAYDYSRGFSRNGDVVVEEFMSGPEVSVETLTVNGECHVIQITDKLTTGAPHFVEMGHSQPSRLGEATKQEIIRVAKEANRAIGICNGPSHTEIIVTDEGPKIVELGARLGGDCITTHLVPLSTGIDMVECCIRMALNEEVDLSPKEQKGAAIRYFEQHSGVISNIMGVDSALAIPGIQQIEFTRKVGEEITDVTNSASRIGFVIAEGKSAEDAIKICDRAKRTVQIQIEEK